MTVLIIYNEHSLTLQIMKKIYSIFMMLAMAVVALSFTACSSDDDEDDGGDGSGNETELITIDDETYYAFNPLCLVTQTKNRGMYWEIITSSDANFPAKGYDLSLWISPSRVSELRVNQVFDYDNITVKEFKSITSIMPSLSPWEAISGNVTISSIGSSKIKIAIKSLIIEKSGVKHTINGNVTLKNDPYVPFDKQDF